MNTTNGSTSKHKSKKAPAIEKKTTSFEEKIAKIIEAQPIGVSVVAATETVTDAPPVIASEELAAVPEVHVTMPKPEVIKIQPGGQPHSREYKMPTRGHHKVSIVGFAPTWVETPFDDEEMDIWVCNEFYLLKPKRFDVLFDLHGRHELETKFRNKNHIEWLKNAKCPVVLRKHFEDIPNSIPFPRALIKSKFRPYFTNTISWQIAFALELGYKEIHLYGVNMATDEEFISQRPSVEYFVGVAEGRGVKIVIPDGSDICKTWFDYGFDDEAKSLQHKRIKQFIMETAQRRAAAQNIAEQNVAQVHQASGAIGAAEYFIKSFIFPSVSENEMLKKKEESTEG